MTKKSIRSFKKAKGQRPLICLTAYTYNMAKAIDPACDLILVGDSLGMVLYGMETTIPVTIDMMIAHGQAVCKASDNAITIVDMPFGSYQESKEQAFRNATHIMKETGCTGVKVEGGAEMAETIAFLTERAIPVFGHIGLKPQSVHPDGGYRMHGKTAEEKGRIMNDAVAVEKAGAFGVVAECIDESLARFMVDEVNIPVIGIGSSAQCDGQILVTEDLVGLTYGSVPSFVPQKLNLNDQITKSVESYASDIQQEYNALRKDAA